MEVCKQSKFNHIINSDDGVYLCNTFSNAVLRFDSNDFKDLESILDNPISFYKTHRQIIDLLLEHGLLVEQNIDEIELLRNRYDLSRNHKKTFTIQIATTLQCNFRCPYCYESHESVYLSNEKQKAVALFIESNIHRWNKLCLAWFGGEPLIRPKIIESLSKRAQAACDKNNVDLYGFITTNGYLLNKKNAEILEASGIKEAQITLDGDKQTHDKKRYLVSGKGTYDKIVDNLLINTGFLERLILRVNVDDQSYQNMVDVIELIKPLREKTVIGFMPVQKTTGYCTKTESHLTFMEKIGDLNRLAKAAGFLVSPGHRLPGSTYCGAYDNNYLLIDARGDIHKCVVMVGKNTYRQGFLRDDGKIASDKNVLKKWDFSPFDDAECISCKFMPICMGGCQNMSLEHKAQTGRCSIKHNFDKNILSILKSNQTDNIIGRAAYD